MANITLRQEYMREDFDHLIHTSVVPSELAKKGSLIFSDASGIKVRDISGKEYIDTCSGAVAVNIGYGRKELADVAREQIARLSWSPEFGGKVSIATVELATKLSHVTPDGLKRFFFTNSGSEANETIFKIVRRYWEEPGKTKYKIITLDRCYHGGTYATGCCSSLPGRPRYYDAKAAGFVPIPCAYCYRCPFGRSYPKCDIDCAQALEKTIQKEGEETIGAFIGETVIGGGGAIVPPPEYWPMIRKICTKHGLLLILDEVMVGFGRTGKFWALEHWNIRPDIMAFAKGLTSVYLPLAGVAITEEVAKGLYRNDVPFRHMFTTGGHPAACAVAVKSLEIYSRENLVDNAAKVGTHMFERLRELEDFPCVGDVRGLGMFVGVELVADKRTKAPIDPSQKVEAQLIAAGLDRGLILRSMYDILIVAPPLIATMEEVDFIVDNIKSIVEHLKLR